MTQNLNHRLAGYSPAVLSLFRLVYGILFAGYGSIILFGVPLQSLHHTGLGEWPGWYAGLIELVAGLLIAAGLFTRAAAFIASGQMAVAYFWMHSLVRSLADRRSPRRQWRNSGDTFLLRLLPAGLHGPGQVLGRRIALRESLTPIRAYAGCVRRRSWCPR